MPSSAIFLSYIAIIVFGYQTHAQRIQRDDLNVAAPNKEEHWEDGDESNYHQSDFSENSENIKKGYDSKRGEKKGKKGHHNKKHDENEYDEKKGHKKSHNNDSGYHEKKKHGKKGEKGFKYNEEGNFRKGHSIKGKHIIHKLNDFEQKKKFFDEDYDHDYDEKYDDFHVNHAARKGGSHKVGHHANTFDRGERSKKGIAKKGHHDDSESGRKGERVESSSRGKTHKQRKKSNSHGHKKWKDG